MIFRASELPRLNLCPGSHAAASRIKSDEGSKAAEKGTEAHAILANLITVENLNDHEKLTDVLEALEVDSRQRYVVRYISNEVSKIAAENGGATGITSEEHITCMFGENELSLHYDAILLCSNKTRHLLEYKTGQGKVDTSDENLQVQAYAAAYSHEGGLPDGKITVHMLAVGNEGDEKHTYTTYKAEDLNELYDEIDVLLTDASKPNAKRIPSVEACRYCRARGSQFCPETVTEVVKAAADKNLLTAGEAIFAAMTPEQRGATLDKVLLLEPILGRMKESAKELLRNSPDAIQGYKLTPDTVMRVPKDVAGLYVWLSGQHGITADEFMQIVSVSMGDLDGLLWAKYKDKPKTERPTKDALLKDFRKAIACFTEEKSKSGSLKKV